MPRDDREVEITCMQDTHRQYLSVNTGQVRQGESLAEEFARNLNETNRNRYRREYGQDETESAKGINGLDADKPQAAGGYQG